MRNCARVVSLLVRWEVWRESAATSEHVSNRSVIPFTMCDDSVFPHTRAHERCA